METTIVRGYTFHLLRCAYVTVGNKDYVGRHKSPDLKFAGEVLEVPQDHKWLTPLTPVQRAPLGDTFTMEGGIFVFSRHYLEEQAKVEECPSNHGVDWQPAPQEKENMIYSFLTEYFNEELNITADIYHPPVSSHFTSFSFREGVLLAEEHIDNGCEAESLHYHLPAVSLTEGDHIIICHRAMISALTLLNLFKSGIKVSILAEQEIDGITQHSLTSLND